MCGDLTRDASLVDELAPFDLITGFRFLLNADAELRESALLALHALLRDDESLLVLNNHGNLLSHKLVFWPLHRLRKGRTEVTAGNYLTDRQLVRLFRGAGLEVVARYGAGVVPARIYRMLKAPRLALAAEQWAAARPLSRLGANQMYVLRKIASAHEQGM